MSSLMSSPTFKKRAAWHEKEVQSSWMRRIEKQVRAYGWVVLFALVCYGLYYRVHLQNVEEMQRLKTMHAHLLHEKQMAYLVKLELTLHWQSEADPKWRELILMRELGLVPKGFKKIVFTPHPPINEPLSRS